MIKTDAQLQERCEFWQERLRLQDWKVTARFSASREEVDCFGMSRVEPKSKSAACYICPPTLLDPRWLGDPDVEVTLLHELLHLHTFLIEQLFDEKLANQSLELALDCIAQALVKTSRESALRTES